MAKNLDLKSKDVTRVNSLAYRRGAQERALEADRESTELAEKEDSKSTTTRKRSTSKK